MMRTETINTMITNTDVIIAGLVLMQWLFHYHHN